MKLPTTVRATSESPPRYWALTGHPLFPALRLGPFEHRTQAAKAVRLIKQGRVREARELEGA